MERSPCWYGGQITMVPLTRVVGKWSGRLVMRPLFLQPDEKVITLVWWPLWICHLLNPYDHGRLAHDETPYPLLKYACKHSTYFWIVTSWFIRRSLCWCDSQIVTVPFIRIVIEWSGQLVMRPPVLQADEKVITLAWWPLWACHLLNPYDHSRLARNESPYPIKGLHEHIIIAFYK